MFYRCVCVIEALFQPFEHLGITLGAGGRGCGAAGFCGCGRVRLARSSKRRCSSSSLVCSCSRAASVCALRSSERISCTAASCSFASSIFSESCAFASASCSLASSTRLGKLCLRLAHLLSEFAVRFLYTVGQVGQTDKRSLGQAAVAARAPCSRRRDEFLEHLGKIESLRTDTDHIADKCRRKQNVDHNQPDKRQTEHQHFSIGG